MDKSATFELVRVGEPVLLEPTSGSRFSTASGEYQVPDRVSAWVKVTAGGAGLPLESQVTLRPGQLRGRLRLCQAR